MITAPHAPGGLGVAATAAQMLDYLGRLDTWLAERRAELDALDAQVIAEGRSAELTADMSLAMALWQAAKTRQELLLSTWDSGRVGPQELDRLAGLVWGRLETGGSPVSALRSMAVSLPEAGQLCDALVAQLRIRLNTNPQATAMKVRLRDLRAQAERIRDQLALEPPALAPPGQATLATIVSRISELEEKLQRGGDISGLLSSLEVAAATFERDLIVGAARRREAVELLASVRRRHAEVTEHEALVTALAERAAQEVWPLSTQPLPPLAALGPIPNTPEALRTFLQALNELDAALRGHKKLLDERLAESAQAAARFQTLQARADGLPEQPAALAEYRTLIGDRLAAHPVVLPALEQLLNAYAVELDRAEAGGGR